LLGGASGGPALWLASASGGSSGLLAPLTNSFGPAYAFAAGVLAAVNPCGFAMLPGFMGLYLRESASGRPKPARIAAVSVTITASFVLLFGAIGLLLGVAGSAFGRALPVASLLVGVLLVVVGARVLAGRPVQLTHGERLAGALSPALARPGLAGYAAYGLAYGLTSLSCGLPLFLTVVGLSVGQAVGVSVLQFGLYALGMGLVICLAAVAVATLRSSLLSRLRPAGGWLNGLAGGILMLVGAYLVYYWLTFGNIAPGSSA